MGFYKIHCVYLALTPWWDNATPIAAILNKMVVSVSKITLTVFGNLD